MTIGFVSNTFAAIPPVDATQTGVVADGTYTYTVPNTGGQSWTWSVINSLGTVIDGTGGEFAMTNVEDYKKEITWNVNGTFYVLVETSITATGCTNQYAIQVDVATNDYAVVFEAGTQNIYCADDAKIAAGMEIVLDVKLAGGVPAATYYDMEVQYTVDDGEIQTATILSGANKFNIPGITIADPVTPGFATVKVTIVQVKDINGVIFNPAAGAEDYIITINPIPAKPEITF